MKNTAILLLGLVVVVSLGFSNQAFASKAEKINGWVTDESCAAKKGADLSNADCAKKCEAMGKKLVVVSDADHKIYNVANQAALKGHEGHHVLVTATNNNGALHVDDVKMLGQAPEKK